MNLCIDFGNTKVKISVFEEREERYYHRSDDLTIVQIDHIFKLYPNIKGAIISSTRDLDDEIIRHIQHKTHLIILDHHTKVPVEVLYDTPETLGRDRLAGVIGARAIYGSHSIIVVDAGTCITMDFIDEKGKYHGGNITPGIEMRRQAMHDYTDKLPLVEKEMPEELLGKSTVKALQNGFMRGTLWEVESFIDSIINQFGPTKTVITGGDTKFFEEHLKFTIFARSNLVLVGLNEILLFNE